VPDIAVDKFIPGIFFHILEVIQVAGIGELVEIDDLAVQVIIQHEVDEIAPYKTSPPQ
ncbi:unnamed protein product, partial [marine sediment metagenome]